MPEEMLFALFDSKHGLDRQIVARLEQADQEQVREMVLGRVPSPDRGRAMDILVVAGWPGAAEVLGRVLLNPEEEDLLRASAASYLGRLGGRAAEDVLLESLTTPMQTLVRVKLAGALGRAGTRRSMGALQELANRDEEPVRRSARLGLSVVAYREGQRGFDLPVPEPEEMLDLDPGKALPFSVRPTHLDELGRAREWVSRSPYGIRLAEWPLYLIEFGELCQLFALDARALESNLAALLAERPLLLGAIATYSAEDESYATQWLLLTWPAEGGRFHMAVYDTAGTPVLYSFGITDSRVAEFMLRAVQGSGNAPISLQGRIRGSAFTFDGGLAYEVRERTLEPEQLGPRPL